MSVRTPNMPRVLAICNLTSVFSHLLTRIHPATASQQGAAGEGNGGIQNAPPRSIKVALPSAQMPESHHSARGLSSQSDVPKSTIERAQSAPVNT